MRQLLVVVAGAGALLLSGCGSKSSASRAPYTVDDVKRAFAQHGIEFRPGPAHSSKHLIIVPLLAFVAYLFHWTSSGVIRERSPRRRSPFGAAVLPSKERYEVDDGEQRESDPSEVYDT